MTGTPVDFKLPRPADKKTLTEIAGLLSPDAPIYASWEGLARRLQTRDFAVIMNGDGDVKALIIAADGDMRCPYLSRVDTGDVLVGADDGKHCEVIDPDRETS